MLNCIKIMLNNAKTAWTLNENYAKKVYNKYLT